MPTTAMLLYHALTSVLLLPSITSALATWGPLESSRLETAVPAPANGATDDNIKTIDVLSLDSIRASLIRQEETIIFALIERAQFRRNDIVYRRGGFGKLGTPPGSYPYEGEELSFMEYTLVGTEALHASIRRYQSPEEHAFFPERIPAHHMAILPSLQYPRDLLSSSGGADRVNFNKKLLHFYTDMIIPWVTKKGDDEQHGSTALCDINVLQALSRRVHYGKFVAESKYRSDPEKYQRLVDVGDANGVMKLLTNEQVEQMVLRRARLKAATYGTEPLLSHMPRIECSDTATIVAQAAASAVVAAMEAMKDKDLQNKVDPTMIENVYRDIIIPLTKDIEVAYLFRRCGREPPPEYMSE